MPGMGAASHQSHVQLWPRRPLPFLFTFAVTVFQGFLGPSWIHMIPRRETEVGGLVQLHILPPAPTLALSLLS